MLPLILFVLACSGGEEPTPPPPPAPPVAADGAADALALARANEAATTLAQNLRTRLQAELAKGDLAAAARACAEEAQAITAQVRGEQQVRVGRASLRLRNASNGGPTWVRDWLTTTGERPAEGVPPVSEVRDTEDGRVARVIRPIAVEAPCLACHGPSGGIDPGIQSLLAERYPNDQATGYALGDLRGALWAEAVVAKP